MQTFNTLDDFTTFDEIINRIEKYQPGDKLYYVRYGDGDLIIMYPESEGETVGR